MPASRSRGRALSSAILYVAIVAIWAGVLVPRWLRLRSAPPRRVQTEPAVDFAAEPQQADPVPEPVEMAPPPVAEAAYELPEDEVPSAGDHVVAEPTLDERHARVLRARRRMLGTLVMLTAAAVGVGVPGLVPIWAIAPPALMLAGFFVLLREAAHTDAQRARHRAVAARAGSADVAGEVVDPSRQSAGLDDAGAEDAGWAEPESGEYGTGEFGEATAQVIDISDRIGDQLYDQYTDAAERAVGD